jgi:hypothetical protein
MPATALEIVSGDDMVIEVTVTDRNTGAGVDLTGASARFAIAMRGSLKTVCTKATGSGINVTDPEDGILEVELVAADTESLAGTYDYELQVVDASGNRSTPLYGTIAIRRDIITA